MKNVRTTVLRALIALCVTSSVACSSISNGGRESVDSPATEALYVKFMEAFQPPHLWLESRGRWAKFEAFGLSYTATSVEAEVAEMFRETNRLFVPPVDEEELRGLHLFMSRHELITGFSPTRASGAWQIKGAHRDVTLKSYEKKWLVGVADVLLFHVQSSVRLGEPKQAWHAMDSLLFLTELSLSTESFGSLYSTDLYYLTLAAFHELLSAELWSPSVDSGKFSQFRQDYFSLRDRMRADRWQTISFEEKERIRNTHLLSDENTLKVIAERARILETLEKSLEWKFELQTWSGGYSLSQLKPLDFPALDPSLRNSRLFSPKRMLIIDDWSAPISMGAIWSVPRKYLSEFNKGTAIPVDFVFPRLLVRDVDMVMLNELVYGRVRENHETLFEAPEKTGSTE